MFNTLKNKIKEETGDEIVPFHRNNSGSTASNRSRPESIHSEPSIDDGLLIQQKDNEIKMLKIQYHEVNKKYTELKVKEEVQITEKRQLEKEISILNESLKCFQSQTDFICDERDKIQNLQLQEIAKLKNLLVFREQEALDRLQVIQQNMQQIENYKSELNRLRNVESTLETVQDELEQLKHTTEIDKQNYEMTVATLEEETRHLTSRLQVYEQTEFDLISSKPENEKLQILLQENKLMSQKLEEAHLHLTDVKSTWSNKNFSLETQLNRLLLQVGEETTEKRNAIKSRDDLIEKLKQLEFQFEKCSKEISERDNKIKLLEEEIDDLSSTLRETRYESELEINSLRSKLDTITKESENLQQRLALADERFTECVNNNEKLIKSLRNQINELQEQHESLVTSNELKLNERLEVLLKNAELSQNIELLRQEMRTEREDNDCLNKLNIELKSDLESCKHFANELRIKADIQEQSLKHLHEKCLEIDELKREIDDKNKTIKMLNQRLNDMKKALQQELNTNNSINSQIKYNQMEIQNVPIIHSTHKVEFQLSGQHSNCSQPFVMDEVNFKYLKHVIVKFLTSREVEAKHLIRAVSTLLHLTSAEEKLITDTINWKMSWFGAKPDLTNGFK